MRTVVINLDRRPDRWASVSEELSRHGISPTRIKAVDGQTLELSNGRIAGFKAMGRSAESYYRGSAGCYFSHLLALQMLSESGGGLILEDDVVIEAIEIPDISDKIIQLGGLPTEVEGYHYGAHAMYFPTAALAREFLDYATAHPNTIDSIYVKFAKMGKLIYAKPFRIHQREDYSDILGKVRKSM